jgi:hypothetical protein
MYVLFVKVVRKVYFPLFLDLFLRGIDCWGTVFVPQPALIINKYFFFFFFFFIKIAFS